MQMTHVTSCSSDAAAGAGITSDDAAAGAGITTSGAAADNAGSSSTTRASSPSTTVSTGTQDLFLFGAIKALRNDANDTQGLS